MSETEAQYALDKKATENSNDWVSDSIRDAFAACPLVLEVAQTLSEQLQGLAAERPLKNSELSKLAQTLIAALKETLPKEPTL